jgi:threonine aldolase
MPEHPYAPPGLPPPAAFIDLRSDTVTKPTQEMRRAMADAEVGDDVYGEDPTVNRLEKRAAEVFLKEAALFVPTGTMANTIGLKAHTNHGEEVLCEAHAHVFDYELSMMAWFCGCLARSVAAPDGILEWKTIAPVLRKGGRNNAPTSLIALENTHNMGGGTVYPQEVIDEICAEAHNRGLKVHMDGARIFNASAACGLPVARIARDVDSVMFCVSKGLCAPVGSLLVGDADAIARGRLSRKRLGGGMRQAGVLAAAALIALDQMPARLAEDHRNAQLLGDGLRAIPGIRLISDRIATNIVIFDVSALGVTSFEFSNALRRHGILANGVNPARMRMVTHRDVTREQCELALAAVVEAARAPVA